MDMDILTFEWMQGRAARVPTSHVWANLPTLSLAGVGETNETRETQNIRLVFWGLQRKHEEYCEVGVGLVYPLPFFRSQRKGRDNRKDSVRVAHTCRFVACVRPPVLEGRRAWNPSSHTSQKPRCMRHPRPVVQLPGWHIHPVLWHVRDLRFRMLACLEPLVAYIAKNRDVCVPPASR